MKIEITLKDMIIFLLIFAIFAFLFLRGEQMRMELKYSQNFTAIVNQLNANTNDIKTIAQATQAIQQKVGMVQAPETKK